MKEIYQHMNEQIQPDEILIQKVMNQTVRKKSCIGRKIAVSLACIVLSVGSLSVMTHASENFRDMLWQISPRAGALFSPVMMSDTSRGIRMTVEAVYINGDDAEFIISLEDVEQKNRVSESTGLSDSYRIVRPFYFDMSSFGCAGMGYDSETGKKRYHIYTHEPNAGKFWGDTLTFSVNQISYGVKFVREKVPVPVDLTQTDYTPEIVSGSKMFEHGVTGIGTGGSGAEWYDKNELEYLIPEAPQDFIDEIKLTGIGWKDGFLHIQNYIEDWNKNTSITYYLVDENGETLESFEVSWDYKDGSHYSETFFEINREEVQNYQVYAEYVTGGTKLKGNWQVKFPLEQIE
ncbi:MAG: hypothetical protein IJJ69_13795 [Oscillospiraceae bacterium]|nr:hypothetical protein [Oscillospiraceae bacterium]